MSKTHFFSAQAAQNSQAPEEEKFPIEELQLNSALFYNDYALERVLQYNVAQGIGADVDLRAPHIKKLRKAVRIILQAWGNFSALTNFNYTSELYDGDLVAKVELLQAGFGFETGGIDGIIGRDTIREMDEELQRIRYYEFQDDEAELIHNQQHWQNVHRFSEVYNGPTPETGNPVTLRMRQKPDTGLQEFVSLPIGTQVLIFSVSAAPAPPGWLYIQLLKEVTDPITQEKTPSQTFGYVNQDYVWTKSWASDPDATLRKIEPNEAGALKSIICAKYQLSASTTDWHDYALAVLWLNNPTGELNPYTGADDQSIYLHFQPGLIPQHWYENALATARAAALSTFLPLSVVKDALVNKYATIEANKAGTVGGLFDNIKLTPSTNTGSNQYIWLPGKEYADRHKAVIDKRADIWKNQDLENETALWGIASEAVKAEIKVVLNKVLPVGYGIVVEGALGITFVLPSGDVNGKTEIKRISDNIIQVTRMGELAGGVEATFGEGIRLGTGGRKNKARSKKSEDLFALSANASGNVKAYLKSTETYEFPLDNGFAIVSMLATVLNAQENIAFGAFRLVGAIADWELDPALYITQLEIASGVKGGVSATADFGFVANTSDEDSKWDNNTQLDPATTGETSRFDFFSLLSLIKLQAGISLTADIGRTFTYKVEDMNDPTGNTAKFFHNKKSGERVPRKVSLSFDTTINAALAMTGQIGTLAGSVSGSIDHSTKLTMTLKVEELFTSTGELINITSATGSSAGSLISSGILTFKFEPTLKIGAKYSYTSAESAFDFTIDEGEFLSPATGLSLTDGQHWANSIKEIKITRRNTYSGFPKLSTKIGGISVDDKTGAVTRSSDLTVLAKALPKLDNFFKDNDITSTGGTLSMDKYVVMEASLQPAEFTAIIGALLHHVRQQVGAISITHAAPAILALFYSPVGVIIAPFAIGAGIAAGSVVTVAWLVQEMYKQAKCGKLLVKKEWKGGINFGIKVGVGVGVKLAFSATVGLVYERDITEEMQEFFTPGGTQLSLANYFMAMDLPKAKKRD